MLKKLGSIALTLAVMLTLVTFALAKADSPQNAADILHSHGLLAGTGAGFELERAPTRAEAVVMIVRLTNNEKLAREQDWKETGAHHFTDVPEWADAYVSCAVYCGLTKGISETEFGSDMLISSEQFITLLLRALDYNDSYGHFTWDNPWELAAHIGLTDGIKNDGAFSRGDMVCLSYNALSTNMKNSSAGLYYQYFIYKHDPETAPEDVFIPAGNNICADMFDSSKIIKVGEAAGSQLFYAGGENRVLNIQNTNPSVAGYEISYLHEYGAIANITVTALQEGHTTLKIVFEDEGPDYHAIAFIDVFVE